MTRVPFLLLGLAADTTITVRRTDSSDERDEGIVLDADEPLRVGEVAATRIVLWNTTSPGEVDVIVDEAGPLRIWNVWRDGELAQAWEGDAGMEVDDDGDDLGLRCHDGHDGDGPELQIRLSFDRAWTQPPGGDG